MDRKPRLLVVLLVWHVCTAPAGARAEAAGPSLALSTDGGVPSRRVAWSLDVAAAVRGVPGMQLVLAPHRRHVLVVETRIHGISLPTAALRLGYELVPFGGGVEGPFAGALLEVRPWAEEETLALGFEAGARVAVSSVVFGGSVRAWSAGEQPRVGRVELTLTVGCAWW